MTRLPNVTSPAYDLLMCSSNDWPVTVAERSEVSTVFARSEAGIVGSNATQGMDIWCVLPCV
jgi:hypothetical protein